MQEKWIGKSEWMEITFSISYVATGNTDTFDRFMEISANFLIKQYDYQAIIN
jgi:hypothetical protein